MGTTGAFIGHTYPAQLILSYLRLLNNEVNVLTPTALEGPIHARESFQRLVRDLCNICED